MNKVILMGRLCKDPEVNGTGDKKVARYSLAVDRRFAKSEDKTDFINIVVFGKGAEFTEKYLKKGTKVLVTGRIQTGSYEKDGKKVYATDIIAEDQEFAESKSASGNTAPASTPEVSDSDFMEIPPDSLNDMPF
jgi:single-strand DNA-binding protein